jgi:sortase A
MTRQEKIKFLIFRSIGNFLVLFALYGVFATFGPALIAETKFRVAQARGITYQVAAPEEVSKSLGDVIAEQKNFVSPPSKGGEEPSFAQVLTGSKEQVLVPKDANFSIIIPKIGASAKIFPNVDPTDENAFLPILSQGIAHAKGTVFPGLSGNVYLFAHSTDNWWNVGRYNAIFYLLKDVSIHDEVVVFFEGKRFTYVVSETKVVDPGEVSHLINSHGGPQQLILQTCWPPGTTWQRLLVVARPKSEAGK